jgi:biotin carboxylase
VRTTLVENKLNKEYTILIIGSRSPCVKAALELGYNVILWGDGSPPRALKKLLKAQIKVPYDACKEDLTSDVKSFLRSYEINYVVANTEETVVIGSRVRQFLDIKRLAPQITERFHNKYIMKNCAKAIGIPITQYELVEPQTTAESLIKSLGLPLVIKPVDSSGARDVKIIRTLDALKAILEPGLLAEAYIEGSEMSVETFVHDGKPIFHNTTEYLHPWKESVLPTDISPDVTNEILKLNDKILLEFGINRGMTHSEFYLTANGPLFGELAIRPPGGYYMPLISHVYGFDAWKTYVQLECGQKPVDLNQKPNGYGAVYMIHPGPGIIGSIQGIESIKNEITDIIEFSLRKKVGQTISEHLSSSDEVGHILFWSPTRESAIQKIESIRKCLTIELN